MTITLVVESGQASTVANCYSGLAATTAYFSTRGIGGWSTYTTEQIKGAIIRGAQYLDISYPWKGFTASQRQTMQWPRVANSPLYPYMRTNMLPVGIIDNRGWGISTTVVPVQVKNANCEMALRFLTQTTIVMDEDRKVSREKVGDLEVQYESSSPQAKRYPAVDRMLNGLYLATTSFKIARI